jgi:streptomycin 6-kinase
VIPPRLRALEAAPGGAEWLRLLPELLDRCVERWTLVVGPPFEAASVSYTAPAATFDGVAAVLKIPFPHRESEHEADALLMWAGDGAVRVLEHDPETHALLLERCEPGTHLSSEPPDDCLDVFAQLLPRLWKPVVAPFRSLVDEAQWWIDLLPRTWERHGRPFEPSLLDAALEQLGHLSATQHEHEQVLLHQDLHGQNVLRASREPWLVIDPKPLTGERAFALAPIVRDYDLGHSRDDVLHRLDTLTTRLELDRGRAWGWALGQTVAWSFEGEGALGQHVDTARWLLELR